jgi:endonuclease YncB( thermonuclease family)
MLLLSVERRRNFAWRESRIATDAWTMLRVILFLAFVATAVASETITAHVVGVHDGDTITLLTPAKKQIKIRLFGIDAPETKQAFGQRSKQSLSDLVFGKDVRAEIQNTDRYGRSVAWIFVGDVNANLRQVERGMAWWYRTYAKKAKNLEAAETNARNGKVGLWVEPNPVPPWQWRRVKK